MFAARKAVQEAPNGRRARRSERRAHLILNPGLRSNRAPGQNLRLHCVEGVEHELTRRGIFEIQYLRGVRLREELAPLPSHVSHLQEEIAWQFTLEAEAILDGVRDPELLIYEVVGLPRRIPRRDSSRIHERSERTGNYRRNVLDR